MKRGLVCRAFLLMLTGLFAFGVTSFADTTEDGLFDYTVGSDEDGEYISVTSYNGAFEGDVTIPDYINGIPVKDFRGVFSQAVPDGEGNLDLYTTHIGTLTLPRHLNNFRITKSMCAVERFAAPDDADAISVDETGALYSSDGTELYVYPALSPTAEYRIRDTVTAVYTAGRYAKYLERIRIPGTVTSLPQTIFIFSTALREIILEEGIRIIEDNCTGDCPALERVVLPSTLTSIGHNGLSGLRKTKELVIPAGIENIGYAGLSDNNIMERVIFLGVPDTVGYGIFNANPMLKDIYFTGSEDEWNASPVSGVVPDGVALHFNAEYTPQNNIAIDYDNDILSLKGGAVDGGPADSMFPWDFYASGCVALELSRDVDSVGSYAFSGFGELSEVIINSDEVMIGSHSFADCDKLSTVILSGDARFGKDAFPAGKIINVFAPSGAELSGITSNMRVIRYSYSDRTLTLDGTIESGAYEFLDSVAALCSLGEITSIRVSSLYLSDVSVYYYDETGRKKPLEDNTITDGEIRAGQTTDDGDAELTFNSLCAGIADGTITDFYFATSTAEHGDNIDTPVTISFADRMIDGIRRALKAIVTLLNRLFRFLKSLAG